jgi:hypothetical protein
MTNEHGAIEERLEKLERQNRRMKLAGLGAVVIAGAFVLMGQASGPGSDWKTVSGGPPEVRAKSFVLVDANGETRARLYMSAPAKGPELDLLDAKGNPRVELAVTSNGPALQLNDASGNPRAELGAAPNGPGLILYDANGKLRAELAAAPNGPGLILGDANGNTEAWLEGASNGPGPGLALYDANGKLRAELGVWQDGPALQLNDASGFETHIGVTDLVTPANGETHKTSAASIVLFGKDRKVLWSAPPQN